MENTQDLQRTERQIASMLFWVNLPLSLLAVLIVIFLLYKWVTETPYYSGAFTRTITLLVFAAGLVCEYGFFQLKQKENQINRKLWWYYALLIQLGFIVSYIVVAVLDSKVQFLIIAIYPGWFLVEVYWGIKAMYHEKQFTVDGDNKLNESNLGSDKTALKTGSKNLH